MAKTVVEELVGVLGLDIDKQSFDKGSKSLANLKNQYEKVASAAQKFALAGAALAGFTVITNKLTAEQENLADAVGLSGETLDAYGAIAKQAGLDTEKVIDIAEELNNKIGESKGIEQITAVKEAFSLLGLEFEKINKMNPEDQLFAVIDAASKLEDQQKAVAATDILLGGDANRLTGFIHAQDESLRELLDTQIRLNLLSKESREEAKEFNKSFGQLSVIIGSATKQLAALLGKGLKPFIDAIVEWVAENKELSQTLIQVFSVVLPAVLAVAGIAVAAMTAKLIAMGLAVLGVTWPVVLAIAAFAAVGAAIALVVDDISTFVEHGHEANTVIGSLIMMAKELFSAFQNTSFGKSIMIGLNFIIDSVKSLVGWLNKLGGALGSGAFNIISSISDRFSSSEPDGGTTSDRFPGVGVGGNNTSSVTSVTNSTSNSFNIDATGMDSVQLNKAIDSRVNQQNAIAANSNSTGILR